MSNREASIDGRIIKLQPNGYYVGTGGLALDLKIGQRVVVFELGEEILDPDSGESLGRLEEVKSTLITHHVQAKLVQLRADDGADSHVGKVLSAVMADINAGHRGRRATPVQVGDFFRALPPD
tara:strand:- start:509 stop:877 length:369 start_codon:yes stop_codon:yes gene_type:complete